MNKKNSPSKKNPESNKAKNSFGDSSANKVKAESSNEEVLLKVGSFKYKTPSRQQRIIIGSIVIGLNLLLVLASVAYFYIPDFQQFIYNIGRN